MQETREIFEDRKEEIELYFSIILDLENNRVRFNTVNDRRFLKILKSNFILMLYNFIEACISSGLSEIYESMKHDNCTYYDVIEEIQNIWTKAQVANISGQTIQRSTYEKHIKKVIDEVVNQSPIVLSKKSLKYEGNLDAKRIKELCDEHKIRYVVDRNTTALLTIKTRRNSLAHGDVSFSECARDDSALDLEKTKDVTIKFIDDILIGMERYYNEKSYRQTS
ncbi:MAG: MAE_28990/MAE_18760 family HEPN-like nuclease [Muricomes sp.]